MTKFQNNHATIPHIGGLLLLVGFVIFIDLIHSVKVLFSIDWTTFTTTEFKTLATEADKSLLYNTRLWSFDIITSCVSAYLFLKKKKLFINWYICLIAVGVVFGILGIETSKDMTDNIPGLEDKLYLVQHYIVPIMVFLSLLYILYFILSKRVKATFVH